TSCDDSRGTRPLRFAGKRSSRCGQTALLETAPQSLCPRVEADGPGDLEPAGATRAGRRPRPGWSARGDGCQRACGTTRADGAEGAAGPSAANALPQALGLVAWTSDPALMSTSIVDSSGSIHGAAVWLNQGDTINWLAELVVADGAGMTHGAFAIYDDDLEL